MQVRVGYVIMLVKLHHFISSNVGITSTIGQTGTVSDEAKIPCFSLCDVVKYKFSTRFLPSVGRAFVHTKVGVVLMKDLVRQIFTVVEYLLDKVK